MQDIKLLFETITLGSTTLANRLGVAPMTRISATAEGLATDQMVTYYTSFARGGFGLIITEGIYTDSRYSPGYIHQPGIVNDRQTQAWKKVVDSVHQAGARIVAQIMHTGALVHGNPFGTESIAPSAIGPKGKKNEIYEGAGPYPMPREATKDDIADVIAGFVNTAKRAQTAGFDGVEIHGANGYLLDEFLTDYTNQRTDEYGGSTENRVRLLIEVSKAIREAVGDDFIVGIRISQAKVNDNTHKWAGQEQDAEVIFGQLGRAGLDYIHVSEYQAWMPAFNSNGASLAFLAKKYSGITVIANGQLEDPKNAANMIENGEADIVALGKGALANPDWVEKVKSNVELLPFQAAKVLKPNVKIKNFELPV